MTRTRPTAAPTASGATPGSSTYGTPVESIWLCHGCAGRRIRGEASWAGRYPPGVLAPGPLNRKAVADIEAGSRVGPVRGIASLALFETQSFEHAASLLASNEIAAGDL